MDLPFKKEYKENTFTYLYVSGHRYESTLQGEHEPEAKQRNTGPAAVSPSPGDLAFGISFASFLTAGLETGVLLKYSPHLRKLPFLTDIQNVNFRYEVLANDFEGMGVDKGFVPARPHPDHDEPFGQYVLAATTTLNRLQEIPEEELEEFFSAFSIFGLRKGRRMAVVTALQRESVPSLPALLEQGEVFIQIVHGKAYGYFHSLLIKSKEDLSGSISAFQKVVNAGK